MEFFVVSGLRGVLILAKRSGNGNVAVRHRGRCQAADRLTQGLRQGTSVT